MLFTRTKVNVNVIGRLKVKEWKIMHSAKIIKGKPGGGTLSDKVDFIAKEITGSKEILYIIIKESIHQKDILTVNVCTK